MNSEASVTSALETAVVARGLVPLAQMRALKSLPAFRGLLTAERLFRAGLISDHALVDVLVSLGARRNTRSLDSEPEPRVRNCVSAAIAERLRVLPLAIERSRLIVAMLDPSDTATIERLTFATGLVVEPYVARATELFLAQTRVYGCGPVLPDTAISALNTAATSMPLASQDSTLARAVQRASGEIIDATGAHGLATLLADNAPQPLLDDVEAAHSPSLLNAKPTPALDAALARLRAQPPRDALAARDSLPPQVLRLLVPPFRSAVLFLRRRNVLVGWDGKSQHRDDIAFRDLLLPLTAPSILEQACAWKRVFLGNPKEPATTERLLFRAVGGPSPSSFAVVPLIVGEDVVAVLYVDRLHGHIDDRLLDGARRVGTTLADGLAPFVAAGTLFGEPLPLPKLG